MSVTERSLLGLETVTCAGVALEAGAADRKPFALPGDEPVWGRSREISVEHLRLEFGFDLRRRRVHGVATITFRPRNDGLREAVFDAIELDVESVTLAGGRELPFTTGDGALRVDLGRRRSARRPITVVVRYSCRPRAGLYFNQPDAAYPDRPAQIWTQGQPQDSSRYFPCLDYPGERATSEVIATVPAGWFALSNGRLASVSEDRRRRRVTYHWTQETPHPAYLITLVAGEFDVVEADADGVPLQYYGPKGSAEDLVRAYGRTPEMVRFFTERLGTPYPWAKYATVAVADFIFGGMENTSATTMTDTMLHDERAHEDYRQAADSLTAHELAHQWLGNLLTCRDWSHGWLNESFASYFDALFVEHSRGWDAFRYDLYTKAKEYFSEDSGAYRRPMVENVYAAPLDIFDRHLYERGAQVLDMLRYNLGDDLWWRAIRHYVAAHAGGDVLTHDLQRAVEEATGRNLDWFFEQWVWKGGHPEFKAAYSWDAERRSASVRLTQTQEPDERLTSVYRTPLEIVFMTAGGLREFRVEVTDREHTFVFPLDAEPRWAAIDPANRVLKTLKFEPGETMLTARLAEDPQAIGRIEAARGLAKIASPAAVDALRRLLLDRRERDFVRAEAAGALGDAKSEPARDALLAAAGAEPSRVRRAVARALGNYRDAQAAGALGGMLSRGGDRSYYVQGDAAAALGKTRDRRAFAVLRRALDRPAHNDVITVGALTGLGALRDRRAVDTLLEYTAWGRHPNARRAATAALGETAPFADEAGRARIRERLETLLDDRALRVQTAAVAALVELRDVRSVAALEASAARAIDGRVRRACRVAARKITEGADGGDEVRKLKDDVERLEREGRDLRDRLARLEAAGKASGGRSRRSRGAGR